jgi:hypothetical protein
MPTCITPLHHVSLTQMHLQTLGLIAKQGMKTILHTFLKGNHPTQSPSHNLMQPQRTFNLMHPSSQGTILKDSVIFLMGWNSSKPTVATAKIAE